ncbi:MAG: PfkB family carbohydrate kinase [Defluviitaleaceae bacterium]|nr:PfkB family carbohydrate kinase [Defluviitaleaceae bacterium]MCL2273527.1 PfkB family carbohydrate kinase [Defluviitaleaceae bacterium]
MSQSPDLKALAGALQGKKGFKLNMTIGLDGFVDEIVHLVDKRQDYANFTRIPTIAEWGARISRAAGLSTNMEMVTVQTKLGGNGPILSNALLEYGVDLTYIGNLGVPDIHPVFKPMAEKAKAVYSLANPGHTDAAEFEDGKIMLGKHFTLKEITWDAMKNAMGGAAGIAKNADECHLLGMENWTMLPHMSDIWENMIKEMFPLMKDRAEKPLAFFDLADPEKRTKEDIHAAMKLIGKFEAKFRAVLGLNEKELYEIADVFGIGYDVSKTPEVLEKTTLEVFNALGIFCLVVHPVHTACCVVNGQYFNVSGPYCAKPVLTTGAGDNFNAGFCLGLSLGLEPLQALLLGVSTSGFYVRNAHSPTFDQVIAFIGDWADGKVSG